METKPPLPPFNHETATQKVRMAENVWNTRDPKSVVQVYTEDTKWRNRTEFLSYKFKLSNILFGTKMVARARL
jgi:nuclear transport factor 2 (NTF2) superfamily protein